MRKLLFWLILSAAFATAQTRPDCVPTTSGPFVLTAAAPTTNPFNNRAGAAPCLAWVVTYYTNGASGVSLTIQGTNDANGQPGTSYSTLTANSVSANPATGTNSGSIVVCCDYYPFLRLNAGTLTGTGATLTATVTGYATTIAARGAAVPASAAVLGSNSSNQPVAATGHGVVSPIACADTSVSATTYTCTTSPTFTPATGDAVLFRAVNQNNSGASTLNVNTAGAKPITKQQNAAALASGDLQSGGAVLLVYDGTNWELQGQTGNSAGTTNPVTATSAATAANQVCVASGATRSCTYIDFPSVQTFPAAIWNGTTENSMWNMDGTKCVPNTIGATNVIGVVQCITGAGNYALFVYTFPSDWDPTSQPYVALTYGVVAVNPAKTVIWTPTIACSSNGVAIADSNTHAESAYTTVNTTTSGPMLTARSSAQLTQATSGNGCVAGGYMLIKFVLTGTTTASVNIIGATVTTSRLLVVQAN